MPFLKRSKRVDKDPLDEEISSWLERYISRVTIDDNTRRMFSQPAGCWRYLTGDSITKSGKRIQLTKMLVLLFIPIIIMVVLSVSKLNADWAKHEQDGKVVEILTLGTHVGHLIHFLQRERDMTSFHVIRSAKGTESRILLTSTYPQTDQALEMVRRWPFGNNDVERHNNKVKFRNDLINHRSTFNYNEATTEDQIRYYTEIITEFVSWLSRALKLYDEGDEWTSLIAYKLLIESLEDMGIQRSLGGVFFINGGFSHKVEKLWFMRKYYIAVNRLTLANQFHPGISDEYIDAVAKIPNVDIEHIAYMNKLTLSFNGTMFSSNEEMSTWWFDNMTARMDVYTDIQNNIKEEILSALKNVLSNDRTTLITSFAILVLIGIMSPIIMISVQSIVASTQRITRILAVQARDLDKERNLNKSLIYNMLPPSVAQSLSCDIAVKAEIFTDVSILYSDLVNFSKISHTSNPQQVVATLNEVYTCFDSRILIYDVYNIETIGNTFFVAAGVPKRIGNRHASELCTLALDLLHHSKHLTIPHIPGSKVTLRIGIHSGPVVAGLVGDKMPRYCLFGETVNNALLMQTTGKDNKIQISSQTKLALDNFEGFDIVARSPRIDKGGLSPQTFWLLKKHNLESTFPCYSDCDVGDHASTSTAAGTSILVASVSDQSPPDIPHETPRVVRFGPPAVIYNDFSSLPDIA